MSGHTSNRRDEYMCRLEELADRIGLEDLTTSELQRMLIVLDEADHRLGRAPKLARVLQLVPPPACQ